ncbi:MAG: hypothetical protein ACE5Q6_15925, partial [Dehalococcoidia bacterium]
MLKLPNKLLVYGGILLAVSLAILSLPVSRASADEPLEQRIVQAIEEIDEEAQDALAELGQLDTPEKADEAGRIFHHMETTRRELRKKLHSRASDRFDELNDLAVSRARQRSRDELEGLGDLDTQQQRDRAAEIRAKLEKQRTRLEENANRFMDRTRQHRGSQPLPKFRLRLKERSELPS